MAQLILGVGSSHSPMVTMDGPDWLEWGQRDLRHPMLYSEDGRHLTYEQQLSEAGGRFDDVATLDPAIDGARRVDEAVEILRRRLAAANLDAVIIIGDDQDEHLLADNLPPFLIYWGDTIENSPMAPTAAGFDGLTSLQRRYLPGYREPVVARTYPVAVDLAAHLIDTAMEVGFDVAASASLPRPELGMGHAFGFPLRRLLGDVPIVPIMVNTYNPPTQPRAARCRDFGRMLRTAIDSFDANVRVGVVASGGLSHFIVLEAFDRRVLAAFEANDLDAVVAVPETTFVAGTSEVKNWLVAAAMLPDRRFELIDYVPGYRTPAGTGTGLGFGVWS